jgi:hypothetical protein
MSAVRLSAAVMTHPRRLALAGALARSLEDLPSVAVDPDPDAPPAALRSAILAWEAVPEWATHHLVLQDDALPARDLLATAAAAAERLPDAALAFYTHWFSWNGARTRIAARAGRGWCELISGEYLPTVALLLPRAAALEFASFARSAPGSPPDDETMAVFVRRRRLSAYVSVPNAVEHADVASLVAAGSRIGQHHSACFVPDLPDGARPSGTLGLAEVPFLPHLVLGEVSSVTEILPGVWSPTHWLDACWGLGLDEGPVWDGYAAATGALPSAGREVAGAAGGRLLSSLWLAAYLEGAVSGDLPGPAPADDAETVARATGSLVRGGLAGRLPEAVLLRHLDVLAGFAGAAARAGRRAQRGERARVARTWRRDRPQAARAAPAG